MNTNQRPPTDKEFTEARLTAYALGQLDEAEERAVEAELAASAEARQSMEAIRALAGHVREAARQDAPCEPSAALREALEERLSRLEHGAAAATQDASPVKRPYRSRRRWIALAVAVCLLIAAIPVYFAVTSTSPHARKVAMTQAGPEQREEDAAVAEGQMTPSPEQRSSLAGDELLTEHAGYGNRHDGDEEGAYRAQASRALREAGRTHPAELRNRAAVESAAASGTASKEEREKSYRQVVKLTDGLNPNAITHDTLSSAPAVNPRGAPRAQSASYPSAGTGQAASAQPSPGYPGQQAGQGRGWAYQPGAGAPAPDSSGMSTVYPGYAPAANNGPVTKPAGSPHDVAHLGVGGQEGEESAGAEGRMFYSGRPTVSMNDTEALTQYGAWGALGTVGKPATSKSGAGTTVQQPGGANVLVADGSTRYLTGTVDGQLDRRLTIAVDRLPQVRELEATVRLKQAELLDCKKRLADAEHDPTYLALSKEIGDVELKLERLRGELRSRMRRQAGVPGTEQYDAIVENPFLPVGSCPLSTFSIDVDTASYANVRRFLNQGRWPPPAAVRIEEMVNYFRYDYPAPDDGRPLSVRMEVAGCPWNGKHRLLRIGLQGREIDRRQRGPSNLVFLLDVSGSMRDANKLPLVKQAMRMLVDQLTEDDRVAIATYASSAAVRLEPTCGDDQRTILAAIDSLTAGGSTHGSAGIQLAYELASYHFVKGGTNRVILATDGDLNVGITEDDQLVRLIHEQAKTGVFLTVLGFGTGNLKDSKLEKLADKGNGTYAYVDSLREAHKVLVEQATGSLVTIAKDVKIQIEFNPAEVQSYRLVGYENRMLAARDFDDDQKDAGEIGAGHAVTALYELVPAGEEPSLAGVAGPELKYQRVREKPSAELTQAARTGELLSLRLRYKEPDGDQSKLMELTLADSGKRFGEASPDFQFAAAVAAFGLVLRGSAYKGDLSLAAVEEFALSGLGDDPEGRRAEFVDLVRRARKIGDP